MVIRGSASNVGWQTNNNGDGAGQAKWEGKQRQGKNEEGKQWGGGNIAAKHFINKRGALRTAKK